MDTVRSHTAPVEGRIFISSMKLCAPGGNIVREVTFAGRGSRIDWVYTAAGRSYGRLGRGCLGKSKGRNLKATAFGYCSVLTVISRPAS